MAQCASSAAISASCLLAVVLVVVIIPGIGATKICGSIDIRNRVNDFKELINCTTIEGDLNILLIETTEPGAYDQLSFPMLREITGYLLLYRVPNIVTLAGMFPNLAVIRGDTLFYNYALVIYEMLSMEEIGLIGLVTITRGAVRIEKNPSLCYMDMIDWSLILREGTENNFIVDNKDQRGCLNLCPKDGGSLLCRTPTALGTLQELCWSTESCQRVCPVACPTACSPSSRCCDESCIGGCHDNDRSACTACQNLVLNGECVDECPPSTFEFKRRRCISEQDCYMYNGWKLHDGGCIKECPIGYITNTTDPHYCQQCEGPCPKVCEGDQIINSLSDTASLAGCTVINGSLLIGIKSGTNIMNELEKNLGMIEEVTGSVVIRMAYSLVSLNFLKHLKRIGGDSLENGLYSFYLLDNRNLQQLFDNRSYPNLTIANGSLFFHNNPKLCKSYITEFQSRATFLVSPRRDNIGTNGDQVACIIKKILIKAKVGTSHILLMWKLPLGLGDQRNLLGFIISHRKAPYKNVTELDGEDACGTSMWTTTYVAADKREEMLMSLDPWTQYALYVRSYMISSTEEGAQSSIMYTSTLEKEPGPPSDLKIRANSSMHLIVSWGLPKKPNSNITKYKVRWKKQELKVHQFSRRDFCRDKLPNLLTEVIPETEDDEIDVNRTCQAGCCACPKDKETLKREEEEASFQKQFENFLHNNVFYQRPGTRRRRDVPDIPSDSSQELDPSLAPVLSWNVTTPTSLETVAPKPEEFREMEVANTVALLDGLEHFTEYMVEVLACNHKECGTQMTSFGRTLPKADADVIPLSIVANVSTKNPGTVRLSWEEPPSPNGFIIFHEIDFFMIRSVGVDSRARGTDVNEDILKENPNLEGVTGREDEEICLPEYMFLKDLGHEFHNLKPGNYSARIRVTSLAGEGPWTQPTLFTVPERILAPTTIPDPGLGAMGVTIGVCIAVVIILVLVIWLLVRWRYKKNQMPEGVLYASVNPEYMSTGDMYVADEWEFPRNQLEIIGELGKGSFGMVYEGKAKKIIPDEDLSTVAVKSVQANASIRDRIEFLNEASVMKMINSHHVVRLLGVVSKGQPTYVIMEYMAQGDLKNWLRARRPENQADVALHNKKYPPTLVDVLNMGVEVADGMAYLTAHKYVHRDLSARNCLVSVEGTCKVADFGLARDIYQSDYYRKEKGGMLPIRWMAPESIRDGVFTASSDVWSFGVLMWEIATLSELPYQGMSNEEAGEYVKNGNVLSKPHDCPDKLDEIMVMCWLFNEKLRPTFLEIIQHFKNTGMVSPTFPDRSFYDSDERQQDLHDKLNAEELERVSILEDSEKDNYENMAPKERKRTPKNGLVPVNGRAVHNGSSESSVGKVTEC